MSNFWRAPEHVQRGGLPLPLRDHPVFDADRAAAARIGPACDVARREDPRCTGLQKLRDRHAAIDRKAGLLGERQPRPHADAGDNEVRRDRPAAFKGHLARVDRSRSILEVEDDAVLLVQAAHEVSHLRAEHALHRPLVRRHDVHLDPTRAQRCGDFQTDEARADDDCASCRRGGFDDCAAIGERSQGVYVRKVHPGQRQS